MHRDKDYKPGDIMELPETYTGLDFLEPVEEPKEQRKLQKNLRNRVLKPEKSLIPLLFFEILYVLRLASCLSFEKLFPHCFIVSTVNLIQYVVDIFAFFVCNNVMAGSTKRRLVLVSAIAFIAFFKAGRDMVNGKSESCRISANYAFFWDRLRRRAF